MRKPFADAANLLAEALRDIAEFDWSLYGLGKLPDFSAALRAHEQLLTVRRLLMESGYAPSDIPYAVCRHLVETDPGILPLRVRAGETRRAMQRAFHSEIPPPTSEEKALGLAETLSTIVRELIRRRNRRARELDGEDYAALIIASLGLDRKELEGWLADAADALNRLVTSASPASLTDDARWLLYHEQIDRRLEAAEALVTFDDDNAETWARLLGLDSARLRSDLRTAGAIRGWCLPVDRPTDVRLVLAARQGPLPLGLVLHELGHYLHYTVPAPERWQLLAPPPIFDESLATLLELAGARAPARGHLGGLLARSGAEDDVALRAAKQRQWALSALFELQAYQADGESLDALWEALLQGAGFAATFPHEWALDGFYIDDPIYRFDYVVGFMWSLEESRRLAAPGLQEIAARIRELGEAAYHAHWRSVLNLEGSLPLLSGGKQLISQ